MVTVTDTTTTLTTAAPTSTNDDNDEAVGATAVTGNNDEQKESKEMRICQQARALWLAATRHEDLIQVEKLYRQVWEQQGDDDEEEQEHDSKKRRLLLTESSTSTASATTGTGNCSMISCTSTRQQAGERLAMILLQSGRTRQADDILKCCCLPFIKCRLSTQILAYSNTIQSFHDNNNNKNTTSSSSRGSDSSDAIPCRIYDNFLSMSELEFLQNVFQQPSSSYWTFHNYAVEPPSPYFSHIIPLDNDNYLEQNFGALGTIIRRIQTILTTTSTEEDDDDDDKSNNRTTRTTTTTKPFAPLVQRCTHVEMWAHNRPHATGHQLHFDSDNEGQGNRIRHPVVSCILYLSESSSSESSSSSTCSTMTMSSPPSLITNQRRVSHRAADKGWLIEPKLRRLAVFDGRVLHGVLPGQGVLSASSSSTSSPTSTRRVTLMLAFWRHIQVRSSSPQPPPPQPPSLSSSSISVDQAAASTTTTTTPTRRRGGAAQPFPMNQKTDESGTLSKNDDGDSSSSCWAWQLRQPLPLDNASSNSSSKPTLADPIPLDHVYETLDGQPWTHKLGMPEYNEVFQGF